MQFVIYDDSPEAAKQLCDLLRPLLPESISLQYARTPEDADKLISPQTAVVFQDIELGDDLNGIAAAEAFRERFPQLRFVFITAHTQYYEQIFSVEPLAFLQKPFRAESVRRCVELLRKRLSIDTEQITVQLTKNTISTLQLADVVCIENNNRRLLFRQANGNVKYTLRMRMGEIEPLLPDCFVRCHYSFCVNMMHITELRRQCFELANGTEVPISSKRFAETKERYITFLGSRL